MHGALRVKETMVYANEKKIYNSNRNLIMIENTKIKLISLIAYSQHQVGENIWSSLKFNIEVTFT